MSLNKIETVVCDSTEYIDHHKDHYFNIFKVYADKKKAVKLFNNFIGLFIKLQMFIKGKKTNSVAVLIKDVQYQKILFVKITSDVDLQDHDMVDVESMIIYFKVIIKLLKQLDYADHSSDEPELNGCGMNGITKKYDIRYRNPHKRPVESVPKITFDQALKMLQNDPESMLKAEKKLQEIYDLLKMLITITCGLQKEYFRKINSYNMYDPSIPINMVDIEFSNRLLDVYLEQYSQIIGDVFKSTLYDTFHITLFLQNMEEFTLCVIDNFGIKLMTKSGSKKLEFDIGKNRYYVTYINGGVNVETALCILKANFETLRTITYAIKSNQRLIKHWLCTVNAMLKTSCKL